MYSKKSRQFIATSKSGFVWYLDQDLEVVTYNSVVAGSDAGGYVWRQALRDARCDEDVGVFLANANNARMPITLLDQTISTAGAFVKYDGLGRVKWITPATNGDFIYGSLGITNDIVYGSTRYQGLLTFLRQSDGRVLKTIQTAGAMISTPTAVGNYIIWGGGPGNQLLGANDQKMVFVLALEGS